MDAVQKGNLSKALQLLCDGADANEVDKVYGWTSLHIAARDGKVGLAKVLLKHNADPNSRDSVGQTPLHRAAFWGKLDICRLLLENGADFTAMDNMMQTAEELARMNGHKECAGLIVQCLVFLEFGGLQNYTPETVARMKKQLKDKEREERRRRELREELERHGEEADKLREKQRQKEVKILEKQEAILEKLEIVKEEINHVTVRVGHEHLSRKELTVMKHLQARMHKLQQSLDEQKLKLNKSRRASLQTAHGREKGAAWIAFINAPAS